MNVQIKSKAQFIIDIINAPSTEPTTFKNGKYALTVDPDLACAEYMKAWDSVWKARMIKLAAKVKQEIPAIALKEV